MRLGRATAGIALCSLLLALAAPASANREDHLSVYSGTSGGITRSYCDFQLSTTSSWNVRAIRLHDDIYDLIFHIREHGRFRNDRTGYTLTYDARWTESSDGGIVHVRGSFLRLRDPSGQPVLDAAGSAAIAEIRDAYVFLSITPHAAPVPGFGVPDHLCELLGGQTR
jgi:hypothetical protein